MANYIKQIWQGLSFLVESYINPTRVTPLIATFSITSLVVILPTIQPAKALTWYYNVYDDGFAVGTGALTYTGSGDGRFTITSATYTEKSPNPDTNYALSTDTTIPNFFALDQVLQLNQVIVQNGYISAYNLEFIDPTQSGSNYARIFYNDGYDTPSVYDVTENPSNGTLIGDRPLQFLQGGSVVPWDVPNAPMTVVFSTILALGVMRTGKKFQKAKVGR